ncbi:Retrovirus-related Pol polyprotein from transposon [Tetrabaena socialis]|uniref:Retrovirus-related Pol polyprotein from transposon n=1 Tax=Tetrabaena socialis TaxID=47790 RepID=A0A2J7ZNJ0_9CHLO|nr:Retrovirus-related Pol polyprotein from transposon [Tetrabaena socialis]|eukprot:PNH01841.1 Retrovirus-related Pol polyprotein from transposon [Tetrabaena socialis]
MSKWKEELVNPNATTVENWPDKKDKIKFQLMSKDCWDSKSSAPVDSNKAYGIIGKAMSESPDALVTIRKAEDAIRAWAELDTLFAPTDSGTQMAIFGRLTALQMAPNQSVAAYVSEARAIHLQLAQIDPRTSENMSVLHMLKGLPEAYSDAVLMVGSDDKYGTFAAAQKLLRVKEQQLLQKTSSSSGNVFAVTAQGSSTGPQQHWGVGSSAPPQSGPSSGYMWQGQDGEWQGHTSGNGVYAVTAQASTSGPPRGPLQGWNGGNGGPPQRSQRPPQQQQGWQGPPQQQGWQGPPPPQQQGWHGPPPQQQQGWSASAPPQQQGWGAGSQQQQAWRNQGKICNYCGKTGHIKVECSQKKEDESSGYGYGGGRGGDRRSEQYTFAVRVEQQASDQDSYATSWQLDSAADCHTTYDAAELHDYRPSCGFVIVADGSKAKVVGMGTLKLNDVIDGVEKEVTIENVRHVPTLRHKLISAGSMIRTMTESRKPGAQIVQTSSGSTISYLMGCTRIPVLSAQQLGTRQILRARSVWPQPAVIAAVKETAELWHRRLAHLSHRRIHRMVAEDMVSGVGVPAAAFRKAAAEVCEPCVLAKQTQRPFVSSGRVTTGPLQRAHMDALEMPGPALSGARRRCSSSGGRRHGGRKENGALRTGGGC